MNAIISESQEQDEVLDSQGLATMTFTLHWADGRATHQDELHLPKFSVWREADFLAGGLGQKIPGMRVGDGAQAELSAGELTGAWDASQEFSTSPDHFDRQYRRGLTVERVLADVHSGRIFATTGTLIMDAVAVFMIVLSLSGFVLWLQHSRREAEIERRNGRRR